MRPSGGEEQVGLLLGHDLMQEYCMFGGPSVGSMNAVAHAGVSQTVAISSLPVAGPSGSL